MKNLKKLSGILLAIAVLLACTVSAFAAGTSGVFNDSNGKITIKNTVNGATYSIYRIFNLESFNTEPNAGVDPAYSYRVNPAWSNFINQGTIKGAYVDVDGNGYVTWKEGADKVQFAAKAIEYAQATATKIDPESGHIKTSTEDGSDVVFQGLPLGYYLVDSSVGALCALTTTDPTVDVIEKNPRPVLTKQVQEASNSNWGETNDAKLGDTVNFKATINVFGYVSSYVMHDEMADGFAFDAITSIIKKSGASESTLTENTDYLLKTTGITDTCAFEIVFQDSFLDGLKSGDVIVVEYTAKLDTDATIRNTGNSNKAYLSYKDYNSNPNSTAPAETKTYTWDIPVLKYANNDTNKVLPGATFALYSNEAATDVIKLKNVTGTTYRVATATEISNDDLSIIDSITTDSTGRFIIQGLDSGTYYLKETKAPTGYNELETLVKVVIDSNGVLTIKIGEGSAAAGTEVQVNNNSGSILPSTGGIGTTIFYIVGGVLVAAAVVLLVAKKRTSENR